MDIRPKMSTCAISKSAAVNVQQYGSVAGSPSSTSFCAAALSASEHLFRLSFAMLLVITCKTGKSVHAAFHTLNGARDEHTRDQFDAPKLMNSINVT